MPRRARWRLLTLLALALSMAAPAQRPDISWDGSRLRVAPSEMRIFSGRVLERLRNGAAVALNFQLTASAGARVLRRAVERFIVSYDLWEERFSVTRTTGARQSVSHLTQSQAEAWCFEQISLSTDALDPGRPITLRLEVRAEEPKNARPAEGDSGLSLTALIEVFSRPARGHEQSWSFERGPFRLSEVSQNGKSQGGK
ncbi:MAG: hypothetical protein KIT09_13345 [Bryobacteraceae bacterium]|nr:hypothetical protein [Bryobacteraceae bacterium]